MMAGFRKEMGRHLLKWSAWVFTVGGTLLALWWAKEHWWISVLIVLTIAGASLTFAYDKYQRSRKAEERHQAEINASRVREQAVVERLREAERKLNDVPSTILLQLQAVIQAHAFTELARRLVAHAEYVGRMRDFANASAKSITPKVFTRRAGDLYVLAKVETAALTHMRVGDVFMLIRKAASGLETISARLVVHQPPDLRKEVVYFRIMDDVGDEMNHIDRLAQSGDVEGIKGYRVQPACDIARYGSLDMGNLAAAIERLVREIEPFRGGAQ